MKATAQAQHQSANRIGWLMSTCVDADDLARSATNHRANASGNMHIIRVACKLAAVFLDMSMLFDAFLRLAPKHIQLPAVSDLLTGNYEAEGTNPPTGTRAMTRIM